VGRAVVVEETCKKAVASRAKLLPVEDPASLSKGKEKKQNKRRI
jgi:hypothetical protein